MRQSDVPDTISNTENVVLIKLAGQNLSAHFKQNLFKKALVLRYKGTNYTKYFEAKSRVGYTFKVVERITGEKLTT